MAGIPSGRCYFRPVRMRSRLAFILTLAVMSTAISAASATAQEPPPELLPDLRGMPPEDLRVRTDESVRNLRLTTSVGNGGAGAFEIFPEPDTGADCDGDGNTDDDRLAYQRVFRDVDGDDRFDRAVDIASSEYLAGCMRFHPAHRHWHFEDLASYDLRVPGTGQVVASTTKVGFCLLDIWPFDPALGGHPGDGYYGDCSEDADMGISVGWADTYDWQLAGQTIDIRNVPDGHYCLSVTGDPSDIVREADEANNRSETLITLSGSTVVDSGSPCVLRSVISQAEDVTINASQAKCKKRGKKAKRGKKPRRCRVRRS